ncbi:MAG: hypothetical protein ACYTXI_43090 [Nostoc sp.]
MASKIFSIRLDDRVVAALEALQSPDDDSLNTTLKRFVIDALGIDVHSSINTVNSTVNNDERMQELIDSKTAYLADAMNEVKHSLESEIEALKTRLTEQEIKLGES